MIRTHAPARSAFLPRKRGKVTLVCDATIAIKRGCIGSWDALPYDEYGVTLSLAAIPPADSPSAGMVNETISRIVHYTGEPKPWAWHGELKPGDQAMHDGGVNRTLTWYAWYAWNFWQQRCNGFH